MTTPTTPAVPDPQLEQVGFLTGFATVAKDVTAVLGLVRSIRVGVAQAEEADARASAEIEQLTERYGVRNAEALGAAMITVMCRTLMRAKSQTSESPGAVLAAVNRQIAPDIRETNQLAHRLLLDPGTAFVLISSFDSAKIEDLQAAINEWRARMEKQADALNQQHGKRCVFLVPVGDAVVRDFLDGIGHHPVVLEAEPEESVQNTASVVE